MNKETSKKLYYEMLRIRLIEEKIAALYPEQEMRCPIHLSIGHEAIAVGACAQLEAKDYVLSAHRSHAHYLAKGGSLKAMLAELYGKATGCTHGKGGSMHLIDLEAGFLASTPIVASTIPIAVGAAFASVLKKEKRVTVVFFGDAATEEGTFHEAANFAALKNLPVVFICENNLYSVYSPMEVRQPKGREIAELGKAHHIESHQADGNDLEEVYELSGKAFQKARQGKGPSFLEFKTYRWREHCGPNYDNHIGYRSEEEFLKWKENCPLKRYEEKLLAGKILVEKDTRLMTDAIHDEIAEAVRFAKESPYPEKDALMYPIYAT